MASKYQRVSKFFHVVLPSGVGNAMERHWMPPGSIIDTTDEFLMAMLDGQVHKLEAYEPAKGEVVSCFPIPPVVERKRDEWNAKRAGVALPNPINPKEQAKAAVQAAAMATGSTSGIERPVIGAKAPKV
jgi:hypothetical protein